MASSMTLKEAIGQKLERKDFQPVGKPYYIERGDFIAVHFSGEQYYSERIDDILTIYRSSESNKLVGCKLKGVSLIARNVMNIYQIKDGPVELRLLLVSAAGARTTCRHYYDLGEMVKEMSVPSRELRIAA
jgi:hypothetical protein